jgi:hypothetical protein
MPNISVMMPIKRPPADRIAKNIPTSLSYLLIKLRIPQTIRKIPIMNLAYSNQKITSMPATIAITAIAVLLSVIVFFAMISKILLV